MARRCNYVKRENDEVEFFDSRWGAPSLYRDFFWGLDAVLELLAEHWPDERGRYNYAGCEAAGAVDLDGKVVTLCGVPGVNTEIFCKLAGVMWAADGFAVREVRSLVDVAVAVGLDREDIEYDHLVLEVLDVNDDSMTGRYNGAFGTVVVIDGVPRCTMRAAAVLELGVARIGELARLPDLAEARRILEQRPPSSWGNGRVLGDLYNFVVVDTKARRLQAPPSELSATRSRRHFATLWPGWELVGVDGDEMRRILALPEFPPFPPDPPVPFDDDIAEIEAYLFRRRDPDDLARERFRACVADVRSRTT